jgi:acyl-CoA hydrolase
MVAVDDQRKPVAVAPIKPSNEVEARRYAAAEVRKKLRQELAKQFEALKAPTNMAL